jgi:hypothetical protein
LFDFVGTGAVEEVVSGGSSSEGFVEGSLASFDALEFDGAGGSTLDAVGVSAGAGAGGALRGARTSFRGHVFFFRFYKYYTRMLKKLFILQNKRLTNASAASSSVICGIFNCVTIRAAFCS